MYIRFKQKNFKTWIQEVSKATGIKARNSLLPLDETLGKGYCFADSIDRTFSYNLMEVELNEDCTLHRISNNQMGLLIYFNQVQISDYIRLRHKKDSLTDSLNKIRSNIFVSSTNTDLEVSFRAGSKLKRLGIYLTPQWISDHFDRDTKMQIELLTNQGLEQINKLPINQEMQERLARIFDTQLYNEHERLALKSRIVLLLEYFFSTYINESLEIKNKKIIPDEDITRLRSIEVLLANEETEKFPSIIKLARIAQMSSTKLKQRFKQVYGYRLYEYYNKQRLEKAKELILQGITPKEAGYMIGFSDVSNFTKAFKKEYGFTPGSFFDKSTSTKTTNTL
nr:AraC family transcriptional regulator [uncultured Lacibacter sp.]